MGDEKNQRASVAGPRRGTRSAFFSPSGPDMIPTEVRTMSTNPPKEIVTSLRALLRRVRRMQVLRGMAGVAIVLLGGLLLIMAVDFFLSPLPVMVRWILLGGLVAGTAAAMWSWLFRPLTKRITLVQVARWLETRHPEIQERVSTTLELTGRPGEGISESLLEELVLEARGDVKEVDPDLEVRSRRARRWMWPAVALGGVFVLLFAIFPGEARRLFVRAVAPFAEVGNAGAVRFTIAPRDLEVLEGEEVRIEISYSDPQAKELTLVMEREGMEPLSETIEVARVVDGVSEFEYRLPAARESFHYYARIGRAQSDGFDVTVWPLPRLRDGKLEYRFPEYTALAPQRRSLDQGVTALAGTTVKLEGMTNTPVEGGRLVVDGEEMASLTIEPGAGGGRVEVRWTLQPEKEGVGQVLLRHRLGGEIEGARFPVKVQRDRIPVVTLLAPVQRELRLRPDEDVRLRYEVWEDVELRGLEVELQVNGREVDPLPGAMPQRDPQSPKPRWQGEEGVAIGALLDQHGESQEIRMRLAVSDVLPESMGGPGVGYSEWRIVTIDRDAESLVRQELRAQQSDVRETVGEVIQEVREAKQAMERRRHEMREEHLSEQAAGDLAEAREKLTRAQEELGRLAERMERGVQAAKADDVREAAREVAESRRHLEDAPLHDTAEGRQNELQEARQAAEDAIEQLRELEEAVQRDEGKLEQVAQLAELAQQENALARQAENEARREGRDAPAHEALRQRQQEIEGALQHHVNQSPEAKGEMLERQAAAAAELAERARELAERQEKLAEAAGRRAVDQEARPGEDPPSEQGTPQDGSPPEGAEELDDAQRELAGQLGEQLAEEQAAIVEGVQEQLAEARRNLEERANFLPEAEGQARDALEAIREDLPEAAAEAARQAAESLEDLAQPGEGAAGEREGEGEGSGEDSGEGEGEGSGEGEGEGSGEGEGEDSGEGEGEDSGEGEGEGSGEGEGEGSGEGEGEGSGEGEGEDSGQGGDAADPELAELAERQGEIARALEMLEAGKVEETLRAVQEIQAAKAGALAEEIGDLPQLNGQSGAMAQAAQQAGQGSQQAEGAAQSARRGQAQAAAQQHAQASESLQGAAQALQEAARQFGEQARQAAGQQPGPNQLPGDGRVFGGGPPGGCQGLPGAAGRGQAPVQSRGGPGPLTQAARQAMQAMQSGSQAGQGQPGQQPGDPAQQPGRPGGQPGEEPEEGSRSQQADPGVPPELAELGVSAGDWEKLKEILRSDVAGGAGVGVPEDYRGLVKRYFQEVARGAK